MHLDARGLPISTASAKAAAAFDHLIVGYLTQRADTPARLTLLEADPDFALAHCMQGYFAMLAYKQATVPAAVEAARTAQSRPCPIPAIAAACRDVEAATLAPDGSPPITRTTFPTCRAHYPGGSSGCACRLLPRSRGLPQMAGGSASALALSRPAQASLTLRPTGLLSAQGDLCHEAPALPVTQPSCSSATRSIDNSLGGILLHW